MYFRLALRQPLFFFLNKGSFHNQTIGYIINTVFFFIINMLIVWRVVDINLIRKSILLLIFTVDFSISFESARRGTLEFNFL